MMMMVTYLSFSKQKVVTVGCKMKHYPSTHTHESYLFMFCTSALWAEIKELDLVGTFWLMPTWKISLSIYDYMTHIFGTKVRTLVVKSERSISISFCNRFAGPDLARFYSSFSIFHLYSPIALLFAPVCFQTRHRVLVPVRTCWELSSYPFFLRVLFSWNGTNYQYNFYYLNLIIPFFN